MSRRAPAIVIADMLRCIEHVSSYTADLTFEHFSKNYMVIEACLYNIQTIGEAVSQLDDKVKSDHPQVPWSSIKGMRNRLVHAYFGTDLELVWNVIKEDLPLLKEELTSIYNTLQQDQQ